MHCALGDSACKRTETTAASEAGAARPDLLCLAALREAMNARLHRREAEHKAADEDTALMPDLLTRARTD